jgi:hypothetical protein
VDSVTIQQTRKVIKIQQAIAMLVLVLGIVLTVMANSAGPDAAKSSMMANGILTSIGGVVWLIGMRMAKWWHHD